MHSLSLHPLPTLLQHRCAVHCILWILSLSILPISALAAPTEHIDTLSSAELRSLVEPIALYPDPLLQNILAAATFPDQIIDAALLIKSKSDAKKIEEQDWDTSVKIIASYPGILAMMHRKIDWTASLGEAFLQQHRDTLDAIQRLRKEAKASGELTSNGNQKVSTENGGQGNEVIVIEPQDLQVIYVPSDPVYVTSNDHNDALVPLATFGLGLAIGSAMNDDDDHYYYGGWGGPAYWYDDAPYNKWMDNRRAAWEDYNDRAWDRQDHRQEMQRNRQDFRQDSIKDGTWKPPSAEQRAGAQQNLSDKKAQAQSRASSARGSWSTQSSTRTTAQSRGWSTASASSFQNRSALSGYGSRSQVSAYGSRGAMSRGSGGFSRSGGVSRGGGGGRRR